MLLRSCALNQFGTSGLAVSHAQCLVLGRYKHRIIHSVHVRRGLSAGRRGAPQGRGAVKRRSPTHGPRSLQAQQIRRYQTMEVRCQMPQSQISCRHKLRSNTSVDHRKLRLYGPSSKPGTSTNTIYARSSLSPTSETNCNGRVYPLPVMRMPHSEYVGNENNYEPNEIVDWPRSAVIATRRNNTEEFGNQKRSRCRSHANKKAVGGSC